MASLSAPTRGAALEPLANAVGGRAQLKASQLVKKGSTEGPVEDISNLELTQLLQTLITNGPKTKDQLNELLKVINVYESLDLPDSSSSSLSSAAEEPFGAATMRNLNALKQQVEQKLDELNQSHLAAATASDHIQLSLEDSIQRDLISEMTNRQFTMQISA